MDAISFASRLPRALRLRRLPWPMPALLAWAAAWMLMRLGQGWAWPAALSLAAALGVTGITAAVVRGGWRRLIVVLGFAVSWLVMGQATGQTNPWPAWAWLALLLPLLAAYPVRAWRDAPFFPSPPDALLCLRGRLTLPRPPRMLDAGCGAGHGLLALRRAWPDARAEGVEWSWPLALAARWRCRGVATVRRGDLWADHWSGYDLVYVFQRPESMPRVWAKACAEMRPGSWLVSLEFPVPGQPPTVTHVNPGARTVHAWRMGAAAGAQPRPPGADNPRRAGATTRRQA